VSNRTSRKGLTYCFQLFPMHVVGAGLGGTQKLRRSNHLDDLIIGKNIGKVIGGVVMAVFACFEVPV